MFLNIPTKYGQISIQNIEHINRKKMQKFSTWNIELRFRSFKMTPPLNRIFNSTLFVSTTVFPVVKFKVILMVERRIWNGNCKITETNLNFVLQSDWTFRSRESKHWNPLGLVLQWWSSYTYHNKPQLLISVWVDQQPCLACQYPLLLQHPIYFAIFSDWSSQIF